MVQASLHHLVEWVAARHLPPPGQFLTTVGTPTSALVLDANGNATGGVRSPHVDTPVATIRGSGQPPSNLFCSLFGTTTPFDAAKLASLYRNHGAFVSQWNKAVAAATAAGFVLPADAPKLKVSAATSEV